MQPKIIFFKSKSIPLTCDIPKSKTPFGSLPPRQVRRCDKQKELSKDSTEQYRPECGREKKYL